MQEFKNIKPERAGNDILFDNIDRMHQFANEKYEHFSKIWTQFDERAFAIGIAIAAWLFYFHSITSFGISAHQQSSAGLVGFTISLGTYATACIGLIPLEVAAVVAVIISFG